MRRGLGGVILLLAAVGVAPAADGWLTLLDAGLAQWQPVGDGLWSVMRDGTLVGQRDRQKARHQAWLYTRQDFGEYDLHLEWWVPFGGNSGISIRDTSRAHFAVPPNWDQEKTPSHIGYEIQIINGYPDRYPSGSIYLFVTARAGPQLPNDWNTFEISVRDTAVRVRLNGEQVAEFAGEPGRPLSGPIGLQLHDEHSLALFRNIRIRPASGK